MAIRYSYMLSDKLVKQSKPFSDGTLLKDCMLEAASILCPDNRGQFETVWHSGKKFCPPPSLDHDNVRIHVQRNADSISLVTHTPDI